MEWQLFCHWRAKSCQEVLVEDMEAGKIPEPQSWNISLVTYHHGSQRRLSWKMFRESKARSTEPQMVCAVLNWVVNPELCMWAPALLWTCSWGKHFRALVQQLLGIRNDKNQRAYHVTWKVLLACLLAFNFPFDDSWWWWCMFALLMTILHVSFFANMQVVDSRRFGLPQRRRRLYILGSPRSRRPPCMRSKTKKMKNLGAFLSDRRREKWPSYSSNVLALKSWCQCQECQCQIMSISIFMKSWKVDWTWTFFNLLIIGWMWMLR